MPGDTCEQFGGASGVLRECIGDAWFFAAVFRGVREEAHVGVRTKKGRDDRFDRLREQGILGALRNRSVRVFDKDCEALGAIFRREWQAARTKSQLLLRPDVACAKRFTQLGANGSRLRARMV